MGIYTDSYITVGEDIRHLTTVRKILINSLMIMLSEIEIQWMARNYSDLNLCVCVFMFLCVV